ncbi:hypothetical protein PN36_13105 [Candidatus Thiomargarita nelsonii]|uniref:Uncharacterized protein n=1 Tax=Candidatus Thiomargarita nelsonii TaxID=1003181 RepID=A0A4E0QPG9_9GAMM|nr:hypothetical protein PN36_13165 [Candidatus Thiomargarita nelsonii]TGO03090.1 hypothetical protein PN36_13105 [Candidatus Thiomargarita nelsonii]
MPQIVGAIIVIFLAIWVIAAVVWVIQWIAAGLVWVWQVFLMPFFVYLTPAVLISIVVAAIFWGSWIAVQNYFASLRTNVNPAGLSGSFTRYYIISMLTLFLAVIYLLLAIKSSLLIYHSGELFVEHVVEYYAAIIFPAFRIHFPFWDN